MSSLSAKGVSFHRYSYLNQDERGIWAAPDQSVRGAWFCDSDGNVLSLTEMKGSAA